MNKIKKCGDLSQQQLKEFRLGSSEELKNSKHIIDTRFTIPLFFAKYYVVFLFGIDKRKEVLNSICERKKKAGIIIQLLFYFVLAINIVIIFILILFLSLYLIKSTLGIDLFENKHLIDFIN